MDYLWLLSSIAVGAFIVFKLGLDDPKHIKVLNAFTGAYLLCLTVLHLLPELYHGHAPASGNPELRLGILILAGFFTQVALDVISMGVEHGHAHHLHGRTSYGVLVGLCLHAFVEATALGNPEHHYDLGSRKLMLVSIVLHNLPVSIALLGMLLESGMSRQRALGFLGLFASMGPIGMFLSAHTDLALYARELTAFVIGIFMHISTTILFESSDAHRFKLAKLIGIVIGVTLGFGSVLLH